MDTSTLQIQFHKDHGWRPVIVTGAWPYEVVAWEGPRVRTKAQARDIAKEAMTLVWLWFSPARRAGEVA